MCTKNTNTLTILCFTLVAECLACWILSKMQGLHCCTGITTASGFNHTGKGQQQQLGSTAVYKLFKTQDPQESCKAQQVGIIHLCHMQDKRHVSWGSGGKGCQRTSLKNLGFVWQSIQVLGISMFLGNHMLISCQQRQETLNKNKQEHMYHRESLVHASDTGSVTVCRADPAENSLMPKWQPDLYLDP